jgi:Na+/proline symporter
VIASLIAAYMSTISTHLNWGSSYIVNDFYKRFVKPEASQKELVRVGRISTVTLMMITAFFALTILENATQAFDILLLSGAGSGAIYLLRWFWWRINAWTEIVAMVVATINAVVLVLLVPDQAVATSILDGFTVKLLVATSLTTIFWVLTTFLTPPEDFETLKNFYRKIHPGGPGWKHVIEQARAQGDDSLSTGKKWDLPQGLLSVVLGCIAIYSALFSIGNFVYGNLSQGLALAAVFTAAIFLIFRLWNKLNIE